MPAKLRHARLVRALAVVVCLSVCLSVSVTSFFAYRFRSTYVTQYVLKKLGYFLNMILVTTVWNFVQNSGLVNFATARRPSASAI